MLPSSPLNWIIPLLLALSVVMIGWQMTRSLRRLNAARDAGAFEAPGPEEADPDTAARGGTSAVTSDEQAVPGDEQKS